LIGRARRSSRMPRPLGVGIGPTPKPSTILRYYNAARTPRRPA
jgi:hypothetical protein